MNKAVLTQRDIRKQLFTMVQVIFSGLSLGEDGQFKIDSYASRFFKEDAYRAIYQLSKEFPDFFPHYFVEMINGVPYSGVLEDILADYGAFLTLRRERQGERQIIIIKPRVKRLMRTTLDCHHEKEELKNYLPVVQRFQELMKNKVAQ